MGSKRDANGEALASARAARPINVAFVMRTSSLLLNM